MKRNFKGVWIPKDLWINKAFTCVEKCLLVEIDSLDMTNEHCYASNAYFADFLGVSIPTITRLLKKIESFGIIGISFIPSEKGVTRVIKMIRPPNQNDETPPNQNDDVINTSSFINTNNSKNNNKKIEFDLFWEAYPKKVGKKPSIEKWMKSKNLPEIKEHIKIIESFKKTKEWKEGYAPNPSTWIHQERWCDEIGYNSNREETPFTINELPEEKKPLFMRMFMDTGRHPSSEKDLDTWVKESQEIAI